MYTNKLPVFLIGILSACATSTTDSSSDSTDLVELDTLAIDEATDAVAYADDEETPIVLDTVVTDVDEQSRFNDNQLLSNYAFVYHPDGLPVYASADALSEASPDILGRADFKTRVFTSKWFMNVRDSDTDVVDGLRGKLIPITWEGKEGYIFSGWLAALPVPETTSMREYLFANLKFQYGTRTKISPRGLDPDMYEDISSDHLMYQFEASVNWNSHQYYESSATTMGVPMLSIQEAWLLATHLFENFGKHFPTFPTEAMEKEIGDAITLRVQKDGDRVILIEVVEGDGCSTAQSIFYDEVMQLQESGGC